MTSVQSLRVMLPSRIERTTLTCDVSFKHFVEDWQRRNFIARPLARSLPVRATVIHPPSCLNTRIVAHRLRLY